MGKHGVQLPVTGTVSAEMVVVKSGPHISLEAALAQWKHEGRVAQANVAAAHVEQLKAELAQAESSLAQQKAALPAGTELATGGRAGFDEAADSDSESRSRASAAAEEQCLEFRVGSTLVLILKRRAGQTQFESACDGT